MTTKLSSISPDTLEIAKTKDGKLAPYDGMTSLDIAIMMKVVMNLNNLWSMRKHNQYRSTANI